MNLSGNLTIIIVPNSKDIAKVFSDGALREDLVKSESMQTGRGFQGKKKDLSQVE